MSVKLVCGNLPNIPWEDRSQGQNAGDAVLPLWRYSHNPIIGRNPVAGVARIFNSAVTPWEGDFLPQSCGSAHTNGGDSGNTSGTLSSGFIGVFRAEQTDGIPFVRVGRSKDGVKWEFEAEPVHFVDAEGKPFQPRYAYDPRLVKVEDTYYAIWCQNCYGAGIGMAKTKDFKTFVRLENPFLPFNRNAVLFPRKVNGKFLLLSRPSDSGHTPFGDIYLSESPDMEYWGHHRHVMGRNTEWWQNIKVGGGAAPIETSAGWLIFYHGVTGTCDGFIYSIGGAILDINEPSKVLHRCNTFLLTPQEEYEERGFTPNVTFPCATLQDAATGRIALYYGCADTYVGLAFTTVDTVVDYIMAHDVTTESDREEGKR